MDKKDTTQVTIIEDHKIIREQITKFLNMQNDLEVNNMFGSVESFLSYCKNHPLFSPDIILLDIGLPGISGLEGIPNILELRPDVDIMMLTTYEEEDKILKALCSGACSYLSKKASLTEILDAVRVVSHGGSYMSPTIAREIIQYLMGGKISKNSILTERQREILQYLVDGKTYKEIGDALFISTHTVKGHIKKLYRSLQVQNKSEAIAKYLKGEIH